MIGPYRTATAFRVALEERLRQQALESGAPLDRLRKEIAFQTMRDGRYQVMVVPAEPSAFFDA